MPPIIILPGIGGSGPEHWQSLWQAETPEMTRFAPRDWDEPDLADWIAALDRAINNAPAPPVLLAHSLACLLVPHWVAHNRDNARMRVAGAMLVAPPDPAGPAFPPQAVGFAPAPRTTMPFPTRVVLSTNDPYGALDYGCDFAVALGADHVEIGEYGHINAASGIGIWPQGRALLDDLIAELRGRAKV